MVASYLCEDAADVCVRVVGVELAQQKLRSQTLRYETGHSATVVSIKHPVQETAVSTAGQNGEDRFNLS